MFGFLRPAFEPDQLQIRTRYRRAYARCCMAQHLAFGPLSLPFLSYEAVFVYLLLTEAGLSEGPPEGTPTCCRLRTSRRIQNEADGEASRFAAAFGILLGLIKLEDDVRDEGSMLAQLARWRLEKRRAKLVSQFSLIDRHFAERVSSILKAHEEIEARGDVPLAEFARPTADGFGYLFELAATARDADMETRRLFAQLGSRIGAAIIAFDSAADWHSDQMSGSANPLADESQIDAALDESFGQLAEAAWLCDEEFGQASVTARVLRSALDRVSVFQPRHPGLVKRAPRRLRDRLHQWGAIREPGYVYARFDCCEVFSCCELVGEAGSCCEGVGGAAECCGAGGGVEAGGCCAGESLGCGLDGVFCCFDDACCESESQRRRRIENVVGETGVARSALNPRGVVRVNGRRFRAQAEIGSIPAGRPVGVVASDRDVLVVRELVTA